MVRSHGSHAANERRRAHTLAFHRFLLRLSLSAGNVFAWIIVFRMFFVENGNIAISVAGTAALYALANIIAGALTPLSGAALRFGARRSILYGTYASAAAYASLGFAVWAEFNAPEYAFTALSAFVIFSALHRAIYWIPYRTVAAHKDLMRPRFQVLRELSVALMPALIGLSIGSVGVAVPLILTCVAGLAILATFPISYMSDVHERFDWSYRETFRALFASQHRKPLYVFILDGMQGAALFFVWPLAAYLILEMSFSVFGVVISATLCTAYLLRRHIRRGLAALNLERSAGVAAALVFSGWLIRLTAGSPLQIFAVDAYYFAGNSPQRFSVDPHIGEQYADGGHYVDEFTALKEMGLAIGRTLVALLLAITVFTLHLAAAFTAVIAVVAVAATISVFLFKKLERSAY